MARILMKSTFKLLGGGRRGVFEIELTSLSLSGRYFDVRIAVPITCYATTGIQYVNLCCVFVYKTISQISCCDESAGYTRRARRINTHLGTATSMRT